MFVFTAGHLDTFVAFQVARLVRRWALLTGKSQVPLAYGVLALGAASFFVLQVMALLRVGHPFFAAVTGIAVVAWSLIFWQNWRTLRLLEEIKIEQGGVTITMLGAVGLRAGLLARRLWGAMGLVMAALLLPLGSVPVVTVGALGISLSLYVMMCITPASGTPVWVRGRERLRDAAKRLVPVPVPSPT